MKFVIPIITYILASIFAIAGMGAAGVLVPNYIALGLNVYIAILLALAGNVADLAVVTVLHKRHNLIDWRSVALVTIPATALVPLGVYIAINIPRLLILVIFGLFLLFALYRMTSPSKQRKENDRKYVLLLGSIEGLIAGLIGMDATPIAIIAYSYLHNNPKKISANTAVTALIVSATALTMYIYALSSRGMMSVNYTYLVAITLVGALAGLTGAKLVHVIRSIYVHYTMISVLMLALIEILVKISKINIFVGSSLSATAIIFLASILMKKIKRRITTKRSKTMKETKKIPLSQRLR
jgi:uncharacterized membrane protein YfcA